MEKSKKAYNPNKLPFGKFLAFRAGSFSMSANYIIMGFVTIYCTDTLNISPALVGTILLISKIFDAFGELYCGYIVDNSKPGRFGKARKFDLFFIGLWLSTILLFSVPQSLSLPLKVASIFLLYMLVQSVFQSIVQAANQPYLMRGFANKNVIMKVQSYGGVIGMILAIIFNVTFPILMKNMATSPFGWSKLMITVAVPLCIIGLTRFFFVKEDYAPENEEHEEKIKLKEMLLVLSKNKYVWIVAGIGLLLQVAVGLGANTFFFTYVIGDVAKMGSVSIMSILLLPIMLIIPTLSKKFTISTIISAGSIFGVVGGIIVFLANDNMTIVLAASILTTLAVLAPPYMSAVMLVDCATYNRYKGFKSMDATLAAVTQFGGNLGLGIGAQITGLTLSLSGYVGGADVQNATSILGIRVLYGLIPAFAYLLIALLALTFNIEKKIPQMEQAIADREASQLNL